MIDNSKKLDELESKMTILEQTLNEIKEAIKEKREVVASDTDKSIYDKEHNLSETERNKIQDIMGRFDFEKVHDIMKSLGWKWAFSKNEVPSVEELKSEAHRLLVDACVEKTPISTGGFRAVYEHDSMWDEDESYLCLEFIVEECEGFDED